MKIIPFIFFLSLLFFSSTAQQVHSIIKVQLNEKKGFNANNPFQLNPLNLVEDFKKFRFPRSNKVKDFLLGFIDLNSFQILFNKKDNSVNNLLQFEKMNTIYGFNETQFFKQGFHCRLYFYVGMRNGEKIFIFDEDGDLSFLNNKIHSVKEKSDSEYFYFNVKRRLVYKNKIAYKKFDIAVNPFYFDSTDAISTNPNLQLYVSPASNYYGHFKFQNISANIFLCKQDFDLFYPRLLTRLFIENIKIDSTNGLTVQVGDTFNLSKCRFKFKNFDLNNKIITFEYLGKTNYGLLISEKINIKLLEHFDTTKKNLLFFTGSWCSPCKIVLGKLLELHKSAEFNNKFNIININYERTYANFKQYIDFNKIPWKLIFDQWNDTSKLSLRYKFNIVGYPTIFIVDREGQILSKATDLNSCLKMLNKVNF